MANLAERQAAMRKRLANPVRFRERRERLPKRQELTPLVEVRISPEQLQYGSLSAFMYHLDHLQGGIWAEKSCGVCDMQLPTAGWQKQANVVPGTMQKRVSQCLNLPK